VVACHHSTRSPSRGWRLQWGEGTGKGGLHRAHAGGRPGGHSIVGQESSKKNLLKVWRDGTADVEKGEEGPPTPGRGITPGSGK